MFSINIVNSDAFLDMPAGAQNLYFHLNMRADDDGFVNSPRMVMRIVGADEKDLALLISKGYLLSFDNGVVVITHWRVHNQLRKDRYTPTQYPELLSLLSLSPNGTYTDRHEPAQSPPGPWQPNGNQMATGWQPNGNQTATQVR